MNFVPSAAPGVYEEEEDLGSFLNNLDVKLFSDFPTFEEENDESGEQRSQTTITPDPVEANNESGERRSQTAITPDPVEENNESGERRSQTAITPDTVNDEQQAAPAVVEGSGERLDDADPAMVFTANDEVAEIASMTFTEMVNVESDLHGITVGISNLSVSQKPALQKLEAELAKFPPRRKAAYSRAVKECPGLLSDEHKVAFLEAEDNDPSLAAVRLVLYWEYRLDIFGPERCFLPMTLNGAMRDEKTNVAERRIVQLLPKKDAAGRAVLYFEPSRRNFAEYSAEQEIMAIWYLCEVALEDPEVQKSGVVFLINGKDVAKKHQSRKFYTLMQPIINLALPIRLRGVHNCYPSLVVNYVIFPMVKFLMGRQLRRRLRIHYGSTTEVLLGLEGFCLPRDRLPVDIGGDITLDMAKLVSYREILENSRPDPCLISDQEGPAAKRIRTDEHAPLSEAMPPPDDQDAPPKMGRPSDPRMTKAVKAKLMNPNLSLQGALERGGFAFNSKDATGELIDADSITIVQRKNQLSRRLRQAKKARKEMQGQPKRQSAPGDSRARSANSDIAPVSTPAPVNEMQGQPKRQSAPGDSCARSANSDIAPVSTPAPATFPKTDDAPLQMQRRDSFDEAISKIPGLEDFQQQ